MAPESTPSAKAIAGICGWVRFDWTVHALTHIRLPTLDAQAAAETAAAEAAQENAVVRAAALTAAQTVSAAVTARDAERAATRAREAALQAHVQQLQSQLDSLNHHTDSTHEAQRVMHLGLRAGACAFRRAISSLLSARFASPSHCGSECVSDEGAQCITQRMTPSKAPSASPSQAPSVAPLVAVASVSAFLQKDGTRDLLVWRWF